MSRHLSSRSNKRGKNQSPDVFNGVRDNQDINVYKIKKK